MTPAARSHTALAGAVGTPLIAPASWKAVDFISDLHLDDGNASVAALADYLQSTPADALFVLGDFFEVWVGDDAATPGSVGEQCTQLLRSASARLKLFFMHGNRDFLVGEHTLQQCQATLLHDPTLLLLGKQRILLSHGDALCLADTDYLAFRSQVRSLAWQSAFLIRPLSERQQIARDLRAQSEARKQTQRNTGQPFIDVDNEAAAQWLIANQANTLIHGHTHQPATHSLGEHNGEKLTRVVLSDWDALASPPRREVLRLTPGQPVPVRMTLA